jgi:DNA-binding CsgD family transcriptional regulator/tetratricopeptide (TPR) repeat protein
VSSFGAARQRIIGHLTYFAAREYLALRGGPVAERGVVASSVLIGRDEALTHAWRRLGEAAGGAGQLLFVAGEAGIGKTRLLGAVTRHAETRNFSVVQAAAYPGDAESYGGLLMDLAGDLKRADEPGLSRLGAWLSARLRATTSTAGDAHRRRRLLVQDLVDPMIANQSARPLLVILEDLHWADGLSLEVLGHLAGRLRTRPILVAAAYRSDELDPGLPMTELRTRLLAQRLAEEIRLPRLSREQTARLTADLLRRPAPADVVNAIHERSDGIPLHVEELLAALDHRSLGGRSGAMVLASGVPDTLSDAVLRRVSRLNTTSREVASAAAVIGRSFDFDLLTSVADADPGIVAEAVRALQSAHLVVPGADDVTFDFRHALIRDTLYADTDLPARRLLHGRVAMAAVDRGYRDAMISAHFELARRGDLAYGHAIAAARTARSISAHREALELYRRAVRTAPAELPPRDRMDLYAALADEAAAVDDNENAVAAYQMAIDLASDMGDVRAGAALVPAQVAVAHLLGDDLATRIRVLQAALDSIDGVPGTDRERIRLLSAMSAAYMLDRRLDEALQNGERSRAESRRIDDGEADITTATTYGSVLVFAGRMGDGWVLLESAVARARDARQDSEAARAYRMIGSSASVLVEYERAEHWLAEGIRYADGVELWNHRHYMAAHLAHVQWATGRWSAATETAERALADGRGGITTRITALYVLGYLAMGRRDRDRATDLLRQALSLGEHMNELQRLSPPLWGLAELARCYGEHDAAIAFCERGYRASAPVMDAAYLFPFLVTGVRAHIAAGDVDAAEEWSNRLATVLTARAIPGTLAAIDHATGLVRLARRDIDGASVALAAASESWRSRRRFWESSWSTLDLAEIAARSRRRGEAARLVGDVRAEASVVGAETIIQAADASARSFVGGRTDAPWHPLSRREFDVAELVSAGLTNREIAQRLVLSPKTISAHVEHILTKLDAARRAEIGAWYATVAREPVPELPGDGRARDRH